MITSLKYTQTTIFNYQLSLQPEQLLIKLEKPHFDTKATQTTQQEP